MDNIDYSWDGTHSENRDLLDIEVEITENTSEPQEEKLQSRHNIQIMRRLFHMLNGFAIATLYLISFSHSQMVHLLGLVACLLYVVEQVRVNYPEAAVRFLPITKFLIRAEEQLKESAMVPYLIAVLLTIITFPKEIALVGIYTLAFADPLSAIIGIRFGKHKISENRTVEGSVAFFICTFVCCLTVMSGYYYGITLGIFMISLALGVLGTLLDLFPVKIDDNLTIPLFISTMLWILTTLFGFF